jgi:tetratricopeptide (TPR) repeat protein
MKTFLTLSLVFCGLLAQGATVEELIRQGDVFDVKFQPEEALKSYLPAEKLAPDNAELLVRISRQYSYLMTDSMSNKTKAMQLGNTALDYAKKAVKADPNLCDSQLALAVCEGKLLPLLGNKEKVQKSSVIKSAAEKAVKLDPNNDLAWHMLARWHQTLSDLDGFKRAIAQLVYGSIPAASLEESEKYFKKAIAINPGRLMHHVELGRTYALMGKKDEARKLIEKGLAMPNTEKEDPETKARGRETLATL